MAARWRHERCERPASCCDAGRHDGYDGSATATGAPAVTPRLVRTSPATSSTVHDGSSDRRAQRPGTAGTWPQRRQQLAGLGRSSIVRGATQSHPPQRGPVVVVVVDQHGHPRLVPDVLEPLQPRRALRLVVDRGDDRVVVDERERDRDDIDRALRIAGGERARRGAGCDVSLAWVLWAGRGPARRRCCAGSRRCRPRSSPTGRRRTTPA